MKQQDLTVVGLTKDNQKLVLVSDAGEEFTLPVDGKLRSALRGEATRLGQLEITMESTLRPRDIQARIRAGETPESVAAAAQTTLDRVMGYATPVLAERAHIADRAQRASVRRKAGEGPSRLLGDAVAEQLRSRNVDPDSVSWDAWRREDGRWTLVADFRSGDSGRARAEFVFDAPGRYVVPEDDEARRLVGELPTARAARPRTGASPRRLSAVGGDDELPLGEDAIGMVAEAGSEAEESTIDLSAAARAVRETDPAAETGDADWIATQATDRPARTVPEAEGPGIAVDAEDAVDAVDAEIAVDADEASEPDGPDAREAHEPQQPSRRAVKKTKGRASVPSWDEIMFGGGRSE